MLFASPLYDLFVDMAVKWAVKLTGQNKILYSMAFKQHITHLALESDSIKVIRLIKNVRGLGRKPGRELSHFGHALEIWVKKKVENLCGSGCLIFLVFLASHPLQPECASHCSHLLCQHSSRAWCVTVPGAHSGHWLVRVWGSTLRGWRSLQCQRHIHCRNTPREAGLCPWFSLWSAVPSRLCPTSAWHRLRSAEHLSKVFREHSHIPISILSCPLAVTCESSVGCSSYYSWVLAGWTTMQPWGQCSQWIHPSECPWEQISFVWVNSVSSSWWNSGLQWNL